MAEHTPGPWFAEKNGDPTWRIHNDSETFIRVGTGCGMRPETVEANARLVAAAPWLLVACRNLLEPHSLVTMEEARAQARIAIAKATGGEK